MRQCCCQPRARTWRRSPTSVNPERTSTGQEACPLGSLDRPKPRSGCASGPAGTCAQGAGHGRTAVASASSTPAPPDGVAIVAPSPPDGHVARQSLLVALKVGGSSPLGHPRSEHSWAPCGWHRKRACVLPVVAPTAVCGQGPLPSWTLPEAGWRRVAVWTRVGAGFPRAASSPRFTPSRSTGSTGPRRLSERREPSRTQAAPLRRRRANSSVRLTTVSHTAKRRSRGPSERSRHAGEAAETEPESRQSLRQRIEAHADGRGCRHEHTGQPGCAHRPEGRTTVHAQGRR
jgi:hypothetical protein